MTDELKQWEYDKGYTKGYSDGRASLIEELEKIKAEIEEKAKEHIKYTDYGRIENGLYEALEILDKHIKDNKQ